MADLETLCAGSSTGADSEDDTRTDPKLSRFPSPGVAWLRESDIWVHCRNLRDKIENPTRFDPKSDDLAKVTPANNYFRVPSIDDLGNRPKPLESIWFSHGSWVIDPYCDGEYGPLDEAEVVAIQAPKNILRITTLQELREFDDEFCAKKPDQESAAVQYRLGHFPGERTINPQVLKHLAKMIGKSEEETTDQIVAAYTDRETNRIRTGHEAEPFLEKLCIRCTPMIPHFLAPFEYLALSRFKMTYVRDCGGIDWNKVREKHAGIAFEFRKVRHLEGATQADVMYFFWHLGWDVESLAIWDVEAAFGNTVREIRLHVPDRELAEC